MARRAQREEGQRPPSSVWAVEDLLASWKNGPQTPAIVRATSLPYLLHLVRIFSRLFLLQKMSARATGPRPLKVLRMLAWNEQVRV